MKIFDSHIHSREASIDPEQLLKDMEAAGVYGGSVFSPYPEKSTKGGIPYEDRMACLKKWTEGYEGRLFPMLYIHPDEDGAAEKARDAVSRGVMGFKVTCDSFYPYEDKCLELMTAIAETGKPVMFHSGILWNGRDSSKYNRPVHFEALVEIPNLRFSLAHCSWPWYDECIALYGKFLNAYVSNPNAAAEMFFDLTPGTPIIYRFDLINKLLNSGYDTPHNLMFGTDCTANTYNTPWTKSWIDRDTKIMDEIGASKKIQEMYLGENYLRFLGLTPKNFQHIMPVPDRADAWSLEYANATL